MNLILRHRGKSSSKIVKREGFFLIDDKGDRHVDLSGGTIVQSLYNTDSLEADFKNYFFTKSYGVDTTEIEALEQRVLTHTNGKFNDLVWCASGSDAIEIAMKLVLNNARVKYEGRALSVAVMKGAYHGNTIFASLLNNRKGKYSNLSNSDVETFVLESLDNAGEAVKDYEAKSGRKIIAAVLDPINVTGESFGYTSEALSSFVKTMNDLGAEVVFDEILCGCYRHGVFSLASDLEHAPQFTALSKGLTNGVTPLSLVLLNNSNSKSKYINNNISYGHTFGITPFSKKVVSWVLDSYQRLVDDGSLKRLSESIASFKTKFDAIPFIHAQSYGNLMRIALEDQRYYESFQAILKKHKIIFYQSVDAKDRYVSILAPPYDIDIDLLESILSSFMEDVKNIALQKIV